MLPVGYFFPPDSPVYHRCRQCSVSEKMSLLCFSGPEPILNLPYIIDEIPGSLLFLSILYMQFLSLLLNTAHSIAHFVRYTHIHPHILPDDTSVLLSFRQTPPVQRAHRKLSPDTHIHIQRALIICSHLLHFFLLSYTSQLPLCWTNWYWCSQLIPVRVFSNI